jgi:hypothetical protein
MSKSRVHLGRIAILWRGDEAARRSDTPESSRFKAIFAALADAGVAAEPVVYEDDVLDTVRAQLARLDGVLSGSTRFTKGHALLGQRRRHQACSGIARRLGQDGERQQLTRATRTTRSA